MAHNNLNMFFSFVTTLLYAILVGGQEELGPISDVDLDAAAGAPAEYYIPLLEVGSSSAPGAGFYEECAVNVLTPKCGTELHNSVFTGDLLVGNACCLQLIYKMGKSCHDVFVKAVLELPENRDKSAEVADRSQLVWDICSLVIGDDESDIPAGPRLNADGLSTPPLDHDDDYEYLRPSFDFGEGQPLSPL